MKLITEIYDEVKLLTEDYGNGEKHTYLAGTMLQFDVKNRNRRIYPSPLKKEVYRYINESVNRKTAWGELGHPTDPKLHEDRFSHIMVDLKENGKDFVGKAKLLNTPMGNIAKAMSESGGKLGMSSRALGGVKKDGDTYVVQENFSLRAIDIVADPSAPDAFVDALMESKEWVFENGIWKEKDLITAQKLIRSTSSRNLEARAIQVFKQFFR